MKNTPSFQKNKPSIINAWASFDWANSVYNLTITAAIFPVYYEAVTRAAFKSEQVIFFGNIIEATALYAYTIGASFFLVAVLPRSPAVICSYHQLSCHQFSSNSNSVMTRSESLVEVSNSLGFFAFRHDRKRAS